MGNNVGEIKSFKTLLICLCEVSEICQDPSSIQTTNLTALINEYLYRLQIHIWTCDIWVLLVVIIRFGILDQKTENQTKIKNNWTKPNWLNLVTKSRLPIRFRFGNGFIYVRFDFYRTEPKFCLYIYVCVLNKKCFTPPSPLCPTLHPLWLFLSHHLLSLTNLSHSTSQTTAHHSPLISHCYSSLNYGSSLKSHLSIQALARGVLSSRFKP